MKIQVSHSALRAGNDVEWFVVKPMPGQTRPSVKPGVVVTNEMEIASLVNAGRVVYEIDTDKLTCTKIYRRGQRGVPELDELLAWLSDTGHGQYALDLVEAEPDDRSGTAYLIADLVETADDWPQAETESLPAQLRTWADQQEFSRERDRT